MSIVITDGALDRDDRRPFLFRQPVLVCGKGTQAAFSNSDEPAADVSHLVIDTNVDPLVLIQFSSVILYLSSFTSQTGGLHFDLYREDDKGCPRRLHTWNYELTGLEGNPGDFKALRFIKSFDFDYADYPVCPGRRLRYFVRVSPFNVYAATIMVCNVSMTALVQ